MISENSPLRLLKDWLEDLDEDLRAEIAFPFAGLWLRNPGFEGNSQKMLQWIDEGLNLKSPHVAVATVVMFRSMMEYQFRNRFSGAAWQESENMFKSVIAEAAADKDGTSDASQFASNAFKMARGLPERKARWFAVGTSWKNLVASDLNDQSLEDWNRQQIGKLSL